MPVDLKFLSLNPMNGLRSSNKHSNLPVLVGKTYREATNEGRHILALLVFPGLIDPESTEMAEVADTVLV